jgi:8-oxo-dGTP pyrophosphatase MutT (NUDIX family)
MIASADEFARRAKERLSFNQSDPLTLGGRPSGDHLFDGQWHDVPDISKARPAAVLIGIVDRPEGASVILTERSSHLPDHAGQVAFPGGKIDAGDETPLAAALREAEEEIGLDRRFVAPLGYLDTYLTRTGFRIVPVVATVAPHFSLQINRSEVEEAFEVPLAFIADRANHQKDSLVWKGQERHFYVMNHEGHRIWGVTAGIIRMMLDRLL